MPHLPGERIFGVETEFGTLTPEADARSNEVAVEMVKDHIFREMKVGALDIHARDDVFEPAESGGFLINGARLYIDAVGSHLEYATAECRQLKDLVANDRAGHRLIVRAIRELGLTETVNVYNNSVDHFGGHTFGCHENYLVQMGEDFFSTQVPLLYPFLITRQIFAGVGRVGGHILAAGGRPDYEDMAANPIDYIWVSNVYRVFADDSVPFQLSQRADHIIRTVASRVRFNRALINPKWEHFYAHEGAHRLHLLFGEGNQNPFAYALKVGTTSVVLRLLEDGLLPAEWALANPLVALREVSRDPTYQWLVELVDGTTVSAIELQRRHLELAQRYRGSTPDTDWVLDQWALVLDQLDKDPMHLADRLDWVAKRKIVQMYQAEMGLEDCADALHSVDLEYHNIDPEKSLYYGLVEAGEIAPFLDELDIVDAMTDPPRDTRAFGRSKLVEKVLAAKRRTAYHFDWSEVAIGRDQYYDLSDPFDTYESLL